MADQRQTIDAWSTPAARTYLITGLAATAMLCASLIERSAGLWGFLPALIAGAGLVFRWVNAAVFVLLGTAIAMLVTQPVMQTRTSMSDVILAMSILSYVMAQYRLCSLTVAIFPNDARQTLQPPKEKRRTDLPALLQFFMTITIVPMLVYLALRRPDKTRPQYGPHRRDTEVLPSDEIPKALVAVAFSATGALAIWLSTRWRSAPLATYPQQWQLGMIVWVLLLPVILVAVGTSYVQWRNAKPEEARMIMAEELWRQTRREQRRVARWAAWARKKSEVTS